MKNGAPYVTHTHTHPYTQKRESSLNSIATTRKERKKADPRNLGVPSITSIRSLHDLPRHIAC